jgi:hypothetical protein
MNLRNAVGRIVLPAWGTIVLTIVMTTSVSAQEKMRSSGPPTAGQNPSVKHQNGLSLTLETERRWVKTRVLRVRFLNGDDFLQDQVWRFARVWERYADLDLVKSDAKNAEIRVAFKWNGDKGSWSVIGNESDAVSPEQPTMNFGWFDHETPTEEFRRVVLHEFGHAIRFKHEHQNPNAGIPWDRPAVYKYFQDREHWDRVKVDHNIFAQLSRSQVNATRFDPQSIMLYAIPNSLTIGDFETRWNSQLSEMDKRHAAAMYPWRPKSIVSLDNQTGRDVHLVYKWSRDNSWRKEVISSGGRTMYWRSPNDDHFPDFEVMLDDRPISFAVNRLDPRNWRDRNYPSIEDGRQYKMVPQGNGLRIVNR